MPHSPFHLRDQLAAVLIKTAARISPDEAARFVDAVNQTRPESSTEDLLLAFLQGGIPAVISRLS